MTTSEKVFNKFQSEACWYEYNASEFGCLVQTMVGAGAGVNATEYEWFGCLSGVFLNSDREQAVFSQRLFDAYVTSGSLRLVFDIEGEEHFIHLDGSTWIDLIRSVAKYMKKYIEESGEKFWDSETDTGTRAEIVDISPITRDSEGAFVIALDIMLQR